MMPAKQMLTWHVLPGWNSSLCWARAPYWSRHEASEARTVEVKAKRNRSLPDLQKPARPSMARESFGLVLAGDEFHPATAATAKGKLTLHPSAEVVSSVGTPHGRWP